MIRKVSGLTLVFIVITWIAIGIETELKDSRRMIVQAFADADRVVLRLENYGAGIPCDSTIRKSLMRVLKTLEPTRYPARHHCYRVHIVAQSATGQETYVLHLLTAERDRGLFGMPGEKNYSSVHISNLIGLMNERHPELGLRFFNAEGRCE